MKSNFSLNGKLIVVTGGTGILGEAFVTAIAQAGGAVGIMGRNKTVAEARAKKINDEGGRALALVADVTDEQQLLAARNQVIAAFGRIDGLVNAAGGNIPEAVIQPNQDVFDLNIDALKQVMQINLFGSILPTQIFGGAIRDHGSGSIVNISSMAAQHAITKVLGYSLAKAAIDCYTKWFAVELAKRYGDKIRMNAIAPGFFLTEQNRTLLTEEDGNFTERGRLVINKTPFNRFGNAEELTGALIYLLSDASRFVTGSVITVDGGFSVFSGV
ncbi:MAG TPA: SDR family oxidoreductase [Chitinophagaceae bacterium]|nr:SDR family oxidoreductase [Chitinophagaceae bacterium]